MNIKALHAVCWLRGCDQRTYDGSVVWCDECGAQGFSEGPLYNMSAFYHGPVQNRFGDWLRRILKLSLGSSK